MPSLYDRVRTLVEVDTYQHGILEAGSEGVIVHVWTNPEGYAIDLEIPAPELAGGLTFENVDLAPDQFVVIDRSEQT